MKLLSILATALAVNGIPIPATLGEFTSMDTHSTRSIGRLVLLPPHDPMLARDPNRGLYQRSSDLSQQSRKENEELNGPKVVDTDATLTEISTIPSVTPILESRNRGLYQRDNTDSEACGRGLSLQDTTSTLENRNRGLYQRNVAIVTGTPPFANTTSGKTTATIATATLPPMYATPTALVLEDQSGGLVEIHQRDADANRGLYQRDAEANRGLYQRNPDANRGLYQKRDAEANRGLYQRDAEANRGLYQRNPDANRGLYQKRDANAEANRGLYQRNPDANRGLYQKRDAEANRGVYQRDADANRGLYQ